MSNVKNKHSRLQIIVQIAKNNHITPQNNTFAGLVQKVCCSKFAMSPKQAKEYTEILCIAWKADGWQGYTDEIEPTEEVTYTVAQYQAPHNNFTAAEARKFLQENRPEEFEEIKRIQAIETSNFKQLTNDDYIQILHRTARNDTTPDNIGRILLFEAREVFDNKKLSCQDILDMWHKKYPLIEIEQVTGNVLKVYWDGKNSVHNIRSNRAPIIPEQFQNPVEDVEDQVPEHPPRMVLGKEVSD